MFVNCDKFSCVFKLQLIFKAKLMGGIRKRIVTIIAFLLKAS